MLSPIGKALRMLRLEKEERLLDMADRLEVTSSYLSAIEMGRKAPPRDFAQKVITTYSLPPSTAAGIQDAANSSKRVYRLDPSSLLARQTAGMLASQFSGLNDNQLSEIQRIIRKGEEDA